MTDKKQEIPIFAVANDADCESYLFINHPSTFIALTSEAKNEHHSGPATPTSAGSTLQPARANPAAPTGGAPQMERKHSVTSESSVGSNASAPSDLDEGFLGGGALRQVGAYSHLADLAAGHSAQKPRQRKVERKPAVTDGGWQLLDWWPEPLECMEHEWTEEFYE